MVQAKPSKKGAPKVTAAKPEKAKATDTEQTAHDPEATIESTLNRFELWIEKNGRTILIVFGVVVLLVAGYFTYKYAFAGPRAERASAAMFQAQYEFERDSFATALNGNAAFDGFLAIADQYGSTPQGNVAHHYAGICYLRMGQFQNAIDELTSFKSVDGAAGEIITAQNYGLTGDAYVELGNLEEGVRYYEKAAAHSQNDDTTPTYLKKAGMANEALGNKEKALEQYMRIKLEYTRSFPARDIDKFIAHLEQGM